MSDKLPDTNSSEEIDLGQLLNAIGRLFERFINFITSIFKGLLNVIVSVLKVVINNFKIIILAVLVSVSIGYALEKIKTPTYRSSMLVKPYFDSKFQLITNIDYYNALIDNKDYKTLSLIFDLNDESVKQIKGFEITSGPETENDKIKLYDKFVKTIDSARASEIDFDEYLENRSIYSGSLFQISVDSYKNDIFSSLEPGLNTSFTNKHSLEKKKKRDSMIVIQQKNILESIEELQTLQKVYVTVLEEESKSQGNININGGFPIKQEKSNTKEFELFNQEIKLRNDLRKLEEKKIEEDVFFDTISSFQKIGTKSNLIIERYSLIFPSITLMLLTLFFLISRVVKFVNSYEK